MNLSEFKAWFEGFTEDMDKPPSVKQWGRIKEKIGLIKDAPPVPQHVFHDHYYRPWRRYYDYGPTWLSAIGTMKGSSAVNVDSNLRDPRQAMQAMASLAAMPHNSVKHQPFDSGAAFRELGRAEMRSLTKA